MIVGAQVTVVHGLPPDGFTVGRVLAFTVDGNVHVAPVNADPGASMIFPRTMIDPGNVHVTAGRTQQADPETARFAAEQTAQQLSVTSRRMLATFATAGVNGLLDHDHSTTPAGIDVERITRDRARLVKLGLVEKSGNTRTTARGNSATVWRITARGHTVHNHSTHTAGAA